MMIMSNANWCKRKLAKNTHAFVLYANIQLWLFHQFHRQSTILIRWIFCSLSRGNSWSFWLFFFSFCSSTGNGPGMSQCFITSCDSIGSHCILFGHTEWCVTAPTHFACISSLTPTYYGPSEHTNQSHSAARIDESSLIVVFFSHEHSAVQFNAKRATENYPAKRSRVQNMCVDTRPL